MTNWASKGKFKTANANSYYASILDNAQKQLIQRNAKNLPERRQATIIWTNTRNTSKCPPEPSTIAFKHHAFFKTGSYFPCRLFCLDFFFFHFAILVFVFIIVIIVVVVFFLLFFLQMHVPSEEEWLFGNFRKLGTLLQKPERKTVLMATFDRDHRSTAEWP